MEHSMIQTQAVQANNGDRDPIFFERMLNYSKAQAGAMLQSIQNTPKRYCKQLYKELNKLTREQSYLQSKLQEYRRT